MTCKCPIERVATGPLCCNISTTQKLASKLTKFGGGMLMDVCWSSPGFVTTKGNPILCKEWKLAIMITDNKVEFCTNTEGSFPGFPGINVRVPERGSLGTRLGVKCFSQLRCKLRNTSVFIAFLNQLQPNCNYCIFFHAGLCLGSAQTESIHCDIYSQTSIVQLSSTSACHYLPPTYKCTRHLSERTIRSLIPNLD